MVVTVTTISGVRTVPLERLMRLGFTWNTLLISIQFLSYRIWFMQTSAMKACFQIAQMQVYQVAKVGKICEPNKFIMVHK